MGDSHPFSIIQMAANAGPPPGHQGGGIKLRHSRDMRPLVKPVIRQTRTHRP